MSRAACPDIISGKFLDVVPAVDEGGSSSGDYDAAFQVVRKTALLDFIQYRIYDFFHSGGDDFRKEFYRDLGVRCRRAAAYMQCLFPYALQPVRHASPIHFLDVFGIFFGDETFSLYVRSDGIPPERDCGIVAHDVPVVDGHGCHSGPEVDKCDPVVHFSLRQDCLGGGVRCKAFLYYIDAEFLEYHVDVVQMPFLADKYLEVAFKHVAGHPDDVVFGKPDLVPARE